MRRKRAQALVEFALVLPLFLLIALGFGEAAFLFATQHGYQDGADVLAGWAAYHVAVPGWQIGWDAVSADEERRIGCDGQARLSFPDGTQLPGSRLVVDLTCHYSPRITPNLWSGLPVSVQSSRVVEAPSASSSSMATAALASSSAR